MALRNIFTEGDDILRKKSRKVEEINEKVIEILDDMIDTMRKAGGVGLAAPQVGVLKRIMIIETEPDNPIVFINPVITEAEGEQTGYEGCLSIPGKTGVVTRPNHVKVEAFDENMEKFTLEGEELLARAICHECDHLEGRLYIDLVEGELQDTEELLEEAEEAEEVEN